MPRVAREAPGGMIFHVLNRGVGRGNLFESRKDFVAFERVLAEALGRFPGVRLLAYCVMGTHWHLVLWPTKKGELGRFMQWLTITHVRRWVEHRGEVGQGHVYQGRYKSFPVQDDGHFLTLARYVERNALRANLMDKAEDWEHGSLALWCQGGQKSVDQEDEAQVKVDSKKSARPKKPAGRRPKTDAHPGITLKLSTWPVRRSGGASGTDWIDRVNVPQTAAEEDALKQSITRGRPYGTTAWTTATVRALGLESTVRPRGRPRKVVKKGKN